INQTNGNLEPMQITEQEWATHQAHGDIIGSCDGFDQTIITICLNNKNKKIKKYLLSYYQSIGGILGECPSTPNPVEYFKICHTDPTTGAKSTLSITNSQWASHQAHGDVLGECSTSGSPKNNFNICHTDPTTGVKTTLYINVADWGSHQAHGDVMGQCPTTTDNP